MRKSFCDSCGPPRHAEFTVALVSEHGTREERDLCGVCAKDAERVMFGASRLPLVDLLSVLALEKAGAQTDKHRTKVCPTCGNKESDVTEHGMVGCSHCYVYFREEIEQVILRMHGPSALRPGSA